MNIQTAIIIGVLLLVIFILIRKLIESHYEIESFKDLYFHEVKRSRLLDENLELTFDKMKQKSKQCENLESELRIIKQRSIS
jgi:hypothetical protein